MTKILRKRRALISFNTNSFPSLFLVQLFYTNDNDDNSNIKYYFNITHAPLSTSNNKE